jgi:hypothetical protein
LSRACLGKMFVFIYKWRKNAVFSYDCFCRAVACSSPLPAGIIRQEWVRQQQYILSSHLCIFKMRSFYQDRLGTNIGKALKKDTTVLSGKCRTQLHLIPRDIKLDSKVRAQQPPSRQKRHHLVSVGFCVFAQACLGKCCVCPEPVLANCRSA